MALQPVTATWQQADVDAMVMDGTGEWDVACVLCANEEGLRWPRLLDGVQ